jgi:MinD-like ATPase involved in chromosome partitioning or flagellar assembly
MRHDFFTPRVVVTSGMRATGVSTIATRMQVHAPAITVVDAGTQRMDILDACLPHMSRMLVVTTTDLVAMTATYALIKLVRGEWPDAAIEIVVNRCDERDALKVYERIQGAASHFLRETVSYGGAIPDDGDSTEEPYDDNEASRPSNIGAAAAMAIHEIAARLDGELDPSNVRTLLGAPERRMIS